MKYKGYLISEDGTGYAPKYLRFTISLDEGETYIESGESVDDCKNTINELCKDNQ